MIRPFLPILLFAVSPLFAQLESVVRVVRPDGGWGSGFVAAKHSDSGEGHYLGFVVTAKHCVIDSLGKLMIMRVVFFDGRDSKDCEVAAYDVNSDCAVLWCKIPNEIKPLTISRDKLRVGQTVTQWGTRHDGTDLGEITDIQSTEFKMAIVAEQGDSGGPVTDVRGCVVGIVVRATFTGPRIGVAVRPEPIAKLVARCGKLAAPPA